MLSIRLKSLRQEVNLTQAEIATKIGVARTTYAMYEQNKREPDSEILQRIANFHNVSIDYLLGRTDYKETNYVSTNNKYNPLDEINKLITKYGIEDSGFFNIEKWKAMGPDEIRELESYFEFITEKAEERRNKGKKDL